MPEDSAFGTSVASPESEMSALDLYVNELSAIESTEILDLVATFGSDEDEAVLSDLRLLLVVLIVSSGGLIASAHHNESG